MFSFLKKKDTGITIGSPIKGEVVNITKVPDPTFAECMLGKGVAVIPSEGKVYAPADGEITVLFDTLHAVSMVTTEGVEVLVHVGLETVGLGGNGFEAHVKSGDTVKKGDLLISMDLEKIKEAGCEIISPIIICNTDDYADVLQVTEGNVNLQDDIIKIKK